jgi:hypothetical protein
MKKLFGFALAGLLFAGSADASTRIMAPSLLTFQLATLPGIAAPGMGLMIVNGTAPGTHLSSLSIGPGLFGPVTASLPVTSNATINSVIFTAMANLTGVFSGVSTTPGSMSGPMGLSGTAKICLKFAACAYANVTVPLTPNTAGAGFGVGGTQVVPGAVAVTMQHNAWTMLTPTMTIHTPNSTISIPTLPGGFAHGPATLGLSSAAAFGWPGVVQLVTVSKTYTSLSGAFPELPLIGILQIHFIPEPGTLLLLGSGVVGLAALGRRRRSR